jgi:DNA-binding MarR family transcriptional regulator
MDDKNDSGERLAAEGEDDLRALMDELPLWRRPGYLLRRLHQVHYALFFEECADVDITPVQYGLMTILSTHPESDQASIANYLGIDRTNVADVVKRLEQAGLVARERSPTDKRAMLCRLTAAGGAMLRRMQPAMARAQERLLEGLDAGERAAFVETLIKLLEANNKHGRASLKVQTRL